MVSVGCPRFLSCAFLVFWTQFVHGEFPKSPNRPHAAPAPICSMSTLLLTSRRGARKPNNSPRSFAGACFANEVIFLDMTSKTKDLSSRGNGKALIGYSESRYDVLTEATNLCADPDSSGGKSASTPHPGHRGTDQYIPGTKSGEHHYVLLGRQRARASVRLRCQSNLTVILSSWSPRGWQFQ